MAGGPLLAVEQVEAGYGKLTILHGVDVAVRAGQFVAVLGPNGSGKSTLLKTIFNLTDVTGGSVRFAGREMLGENTERLRRLGLAYVPQRESVFHAMSVRENLQLAVRGHARETAGQMLAACYGLFPVLGSRPQQKAGQLSGGERQMLAIAMGWLAKPTLMLLDEPSAGLSPLFVNEVFRTVRNLCDQGITMVVVEQNARSILRWCDHAYILREGRVVFHGSAAEILADEETVKDYLGVGRRRTAPGPPGDAR